MKHCFEISGRKGAVIAFNALPGLQVESWQFEFFPGLLAPAYLQPWVFSIFSQLQTFCTAINGMINQCATCRLCATILVYHTVYRCAEGL